MTKMPRATKTAATKTKAPAKPRAAAKSAAKAPTKRQAKATDVPDVAPAAPHSAAELTRRIVEAGDRRRAAKAASVPATTAETTAPASVETKRPARAKRAKPLTEVEAPAAPKATRKVSKSTKVPAAADEATIPTPVDVVEAKKPAKTRGKAAKPATTEPKAVKADKPAKDAVKAPRKAKVDAKVDAVPAAVVVEPKPALTRGKRKAGTIAKAPVLDIPPTIPAPEAKGQTPVEPPAAKIEATTAPEAKPVSTGNPFLDAGLRIVRAAVRKVLGP